MRVFILLLLLFSFSSYSIRESDSVVDKKLNEINKVDDTSINLSDSLTGTSEIEVRPGSGVSFSPCTEFIDGKIQFVDCTKKLVTRLGDKYFVYQKLVKLFGEDKVQRNIYYNYLFNYSSFFGGTCDHASTVPVLNDNDNRLTTCTDSSPNPSSQCQAFGVAQLDIRHNYFNINRCFSAGETERKLITNSNTARIGLNSQICFYSIFGVGDSDQSGATGVGFEHLMNSVCGSSSCEWNSTNTKNLYRLFYPYAVDFSSSENDELMAAVKGDEAKLSHEEMFQVLSYSLCADISWQSF